MMNPCAKYEEWMSAYVDGMLDDAEQVELMVHLQTCPSCLAVWQDYELMSKTLEYAEVEPPETFAADVMARIQAQPVLTVRRGGGARRFMAIAAVFAVVAFVGVYTFWSPPSQESGEFAALSPEAEMSESPDAVQRFAVEAGEHTFEPTVENWVSDPSEDDIAEPDDIADAEFGELMDHGMIGATDILPEDTLLDLFVSHESLGDWDELRERLIMGGYRYEVEDGVFTAHDPYRPGSYLYGMLITARSYPGNTLVTLIGYAHRTEGAYSRVELRTGYGGEVRYYYDVRYIGSGGTRGDAWAQLREFIVFG